MSCFYGPPCTIASSPLARRRVSFVEQQNRRPSVYRRPKSPLCEPYHLYSTAGSNQSSSSSSGLAVGGTTEAFEAHASRKFSLVRYAAAHFDFKQTFGVKSLARKQ